MIDASLYQPIFLTVTFLLCFWQSYRLSKVTDFYYLQDGTINQYRTGLCWLFILILFLGTRPINGASFPDMVAYAREYGKAAYHIDHVRFEPVWTGLMYICHEILGLSVTVFFITTCILIIGLRYLVCKRLFGCNVYTAFLFLITSFTFWGDATNIIRSAIARSIVLLAIVYFFYGDKRSLIKGIICFLLAFYCHTSSALLIGCFLLSLYFIKNIRYSLWIWLFCLVLSLVAGGWFEHFFVSLGLDDRIQGYFTGNYSGFSHAGFRWDFLLYSIIPILLGIYVQSKGYADKIYAVLLNTYILSNAFWVLVIRAEFSDRFAALSWTLYPFVIAYPLLNIQIWKEQQKKLAIGLLLNVSFLVLMQLYYALR